MGQNDEYWDLHIPLAQYSYNAVVDQCFKECLNGLRPPQFHRSTRKPQLPEHFVQAFENFISMRKNIGEATFHMIHTDFYITQDHR